MKKTIFGLLALLLLAGLPAATFGQNPPAPAAPAAATQAQAAPQAPRPIELRDILAWKVQGGSALSADGSWFGYRQVPLEGDGEVVFRRTKGDKEYRFPIGESRFGVLGLSDDGKFAAFMVYPEAKEARKLRQSRGKSYTKAAVLDLAKGDKVEYEKIRSFQFVPENSAWIVLHKAAPEGQEKEKDKWSGSDLILRELATGKELVLGNVSEFAFDKKGRKLALLIDAYGQTGNGVLVRDMATGTIVPLDTEKAAYKSLAWTEKGDGLVCLKGKEDKAFEDKLYAVVGFTGLLQGPVQKTVYDPAADKSFPAGMSISPDQRPAFSEALDAIIFGIHELVKKGEGAAPAGDAPPVVDEDIPDLVLWHGLDKRLQSEQQVEANRDKAYSYRSLYRLKEKKFIRLADDDLRTILIAPKERWATGYDDREYELDASLSGRSYRDVYAIDMSTGARKLAIKKSRYSFSISTDGSHLLGYEDGAFFSYEFATGKSYPITKDVPANFINEDDDHNVKNPPDYPIGWSEDGLFALLSDGWDIWKVPVHGGPAVNLTVNGRQDGIRYRGLNSLDPDDKGVDLAKPLYVQMYGEWTKKAGIGRLEKGKPGVQVLLWDDAGFGGPAKARKADVYYYTRDTYKDYPDAYVADARLANGRKLTDVAAGQKDFLWSSGSILLDYKMDPKSGKDVKLQAALFLPANYEKGKKYPTIVYYYEKMSQQLNRYATPSYNGFNKSVYTSNGYAVLMPDITYKLNDPGMSAVWCVLPALDAAAATGIVDRSKVGLQGHSWGGYQTAFLVTQADFAAAVAGAPLTNMISMYSSIYFNSGSGNMAIFESSQGRFLGGYWDNLDAYQRNSPVYHAAKVNTPLMILHNDKDGAVVWNQGIEYYSTLRRMKKPVIMLQYVGENHGLAKPANMKDYTVRMKEWFDHWLMGKPAPAWMTEGIPHLKMKDYLKEQSKLWKVEEPKKDDKPADKKDDKKDEKKEPGKK
ncbi:MAG: prolyl oligopeptidase family serine peptidase [Acidobacteriota bacterium]|nr:prolyl oligopeptidase family serine peptidase [Acidobacteriota bacterium]